MPWTPLPSRVTITIETPVPQRFVLDPATTALVIIDMQDVYVHGDRPRMTDTIAGNVRLLQKSRSAELPVIFLQSIREPDNLEVTRFGRPHSLLSSADSPRMNIAQELAPLPDEHVVQKWSHDPWARTELESVVEKLGMDPRTWSVLVTGVSAGVCAHAGAIGFSNRHFMTIIPLDCTAAADVEEEARTYAQYMTLGYNHNVAFTRSDLVDFKIDAPAPERQMTHYGEWKQSASA